MKYHVGDKLIITANKSGHHYNIGQVVTVKSIEPGSPPYYCEELAPDGIRWYVDEFETELLEPTWHEEQKEEEKQIDEEEEIKMSEDVIEDTLTKEIVKKILPLVKKNINGEIKDLMKNVTTVVVKKDDKKVNEFTCTAHNKFKEILTLVNNKIPTMLTGGAGSGKSSTCEKVAEALGLDFYFSNAITQEYKLTGFIDANGKYQETQFYKAFKNGGLFVLDEIDASVPEALVVINTAIANGYFDFPNGKVMAHEDFRIIACANTYGLGGNDVYVGRNQLDGASLDRFAVVYFDYDPELEKSLVENQDWVKFIQALRKKIRDRKIKHIISMRATIYGDKLLKAETDIETVFKELIFKNLELDDIKSIGTLNNPGSNMYINEFNKIVRS